MSRIVCDETLCSGCLACVIACIDQHYDESVINPISYRIYEKKQMPSGFQKYVTDSCHHCADPACKKACPTKAISKTKNGFVRVNAKKCVGCKSCRMACAYDIPRFDLKRKMVKCDGCEIRIENGRKPACVSICPNHALSVEES